MREKTKAHKSLPFGVVLWDRLRKATKSKAVGSIKRSNLSNNALKWQKELATWSGWNSPKLDENNYDEEFEFEITAEGLISYSSNGYLDSPSASGNSGANTLASLSEQVSHMFMSPPLGNLSSLNYYTPNSPVVDSPSSLRRRSPNHHQENPSDREESFHSNSPHILPTHDEVARSLTDLQKHMLRIVRSHNGVASLDAIVEGIQKSRDVLRKRDGSLYAIDCRRAVAATLAKTSFNSSLFVRDEDNDGHWRFGPLAKVLNLDLLVIGDESPGRRFKSSNLIDEPPSKKQRGSSGSSDNSDDSESSNISSPSLARYVRRVPGTRRTQLRLYAPGGKRDVESLNIMDDNSNDPDDLDEQEHEHDVEDDEDEDEEALDDPDVDSDDSITSKSPRRRGRKPKDDSTPEILGSPLIYSPRESGSDDSILQNENGELSPLQTMMIEAINKSGGYALLSTVYKYVSKRWGNLRRRDESLQNVDCKTAVKSCLSANGRSANPLFEPDPSHEGHWRVTKTGTDLSKAAKEKKERKQQQQQAQKTTTTSEEQPKLTDMQEMLMKIILEKGGGATFEQIFHEVTTKWRPKWDTDCKRALLASLSHNPPGNFKKNKDNQWTIAPKALPLVSLLKP